MFGLQVKAALHLAGSIMSALWSYIAMVVVASEALLILLARRERCLMFFRNILVALLLGAQVGPLRISRASRSVRVSTVAP